MSSDRGRGKRTAPSSRATSVPSTVGGRGRGTSTASGSTPKRTKSSGANASAACAVKVALRCSACTSHPLKAGIAGGREWARHERIGSDLVAVGPLCKRCDDMRMDIFGYLDEEVFLSMLSDAHMK